MLRADKGYRSNKLYGLLSFTANLVRKRGFCGKISPQYLSVLLESVHTVLTQSGTPRVPRYYLFLLFIRFPETPDFRGFPF